MEKLPKCLVILASFNGKDWILDQIESILSQRNVNIHIFIGDDCSTDGTPDLISDINSRRDNVSINLSKKPSGSAGQNFMRMFRDIDSSGYDYVAFADQDDIWFPNKVSSSIEKLKKNHASGISCSVEAFWPNGRKKILHQSSNFMKCDFLFEGAGQGCTFVLTQNFFNQVKEFCVKNKSLTNSFYYHDWLVYLICRCSGNRWVFDKSVSISYRQHSGNDTGARFGLNAVLERVKMIYSGWYKDQIILACKLSERAGLVCVDKAYFESFICQPISLMRQMKLIAFVLKHGRRKLFDRLVIVFAICLGKI